MAGFDLSRSAITLLLLTIVLLWSAGAGAGPPTTTKTQRPETEEQEQQAPEEEPAAEPEAADDDEPEAADAYALEESDQSMAERVAADDSLMMLETDLGEQTEIPTLVEAARAERERRQISDQPAIVITNKNLAEYATGELTISDTPETVDVEAPAGRSQEETELAEDEAYWRRRAREIRIEWREAVEGIPEAEGRVAELRMAFYREDDGFYRDQEIKPAWDKALRDLDEARRLAVEMEKELELFLDSGRRAGALPGWLREGIELEPQLDDERQPGIQTFEPVEPVVIDEVGGGGARW
ncbi:MAG: hypothetical protein WBG96_07265 [Thermoanaerobaculia bacterium]